MPIMVTPTERFESIAIFRYALDIGRRLNILEYKTADGEHYVRIAHRDYLVRVENGQIVELKGRA